MLHNVTSCSLVQELLVSFWEAEDDNTSYFCSCLGARAVGLWRARKAWLARPGEASVPAALKFFCGLSG